MLLVLGCWLCSLHLPDWLVRVQTCCLEPCYCPVIDAKAFAALILSSYTPDVAHRVALLTDSLQLP